MSKESEEFVEELMAKDSEKVKNALGILMKTLDSVMDGDAVYSIKQKRILVNLANGYIEGICTDKETREVDEELYERYKYRIDGCGNVYGRRPPKSGTKRMVIV
jgi:hypothetical protein